MRMTKQSASTKSGNNERMSQWLPQGFDMAMSFGRFHGYAAQSWLRYNLEILNFLTHRVEEDLKTVNALIGCRSADEAFDVSSKFMQCAVSEYAEKASKLADISTKLAGETAEHLQEEAASVVDGITSKKAA